ncbi:helix-turn-helix domain-containing protein [Nocardia sp. NPDC127606]|uniref:helix-turn-helix domain-containing protein n=1 Tax=Nocardia sp. NPDC127606 TaxID=3345406 RepID=UPI0036400705
MSSNAVLREAILNAGMTPAMLAERVEVDAKTVERWVSQGRRPHPITRHRVACVVARPMAELWPLPASAPATVPVSAPVVEGGVSLAQVLDRLSSVAAVLDRLTDRLENLEKATGSMGATA